MELNESRHPVDETVSREQAATFVGLVQSLLRELMIGSNDPAAELPLAQLRVCRVLSDGPQSISAISRELGVSLSAVTQIADRLERAHLVCRVTENADRRVRCLRLTDRSETLLRLHDEERIRRMEAALGQLAPIARDETVRTFERLVQAAIAARAKNGDGHGANAAGVTSRVLP
jgi:DNA-binding MarR family transcriptional regulator